MRLVGACTLQDPSGDVITLWRVREDWDTKPSDIAKSFELKDARVELVAVIN